MKNKSYIGISFIVLIFGIWAVPKIVAKFQKSDLVTIGPVPSFELTNQNGKTITDEDYLGKVYVVEFFFSTCPTICPKMNQNMLKLQQEFYGNPEFGIASVTINPQYDTPQVLKEHAEHLGVKHYNWHFLTGDQEYILNLARNGFNLYAGENKKVAGGFEHSGFFALVDKEGNIRSRKDKFGNPIMYYDGLDDKGVQDIKEDIKKLLEE
ncbi:SCO family protein [Flavobacterium coralii]|uniref:SCO family protein n=1 Tax=Flavobacterium coralii TaxID=2838017 RepID=UPI001CA6C520|nr:SCO family protein [Flavobacterium coralii]MBY8962806.1 SCO family protein [Flavobacterium coralii]|tara:strand:+ start:68080 stop:68706 length:627 start_codon:yes stop_codon:yes gene_type:complete